MDTKNNSKIKVCFHIIGLIIVLIICQSIPSMALSYLPNKKIAWLLNLILPLMLIYFVLGLYKNMFFKKDWSYFRVIKPKKDVFSGFLMGFVSLSFLIILFIFFDFVEPRIGKSFDVVELLLHALVMGIVAGICEELIFRGFIFKLIEKRWNIVAAFVVSSFIFSVLHIINDVNMGLFAMVQMVVSLTIVGGLLAAITYKTGSIFYAAAFHAGVNFTSTFSQFECNDYHSLFYFDYVYKNSLVTGGENGPLVSIFAILMFLSMIVMVFRYTPKKV